MSMTRRAFLVWWVFVPIAILNGAIRDLWIAPEENLTPPDSGTADTEPGIFDLGSTEDPTIR